MDFSFVTKYYQFFIDGAKVTIILSIFTVVLGVILGIFLAMMRVSRISVLKFIATSYIEFIRGTPILVQLYIIYYGLPKIGITFPDVPALGSAFPDFMAGVLALSINSAAYVAEIFRAGIQAIDKGQMEAARSLGMPHAMSMRYIILPQALRNVFAGARERIYRGDQGIFHRFDYRDRRADVQGGYGSGQHLPAVRTGLLLAALIYFVMTFTLSKLLGVAERRMRTSD
ncbi:amino acid ABC transporter permease [Paenibacillus sp. P26]|nr:amino acid ABC transporter permease [Paenibacillus sp. P26]